jgi:enoyl-CoA hydratase/carnithine racemase
MASLPSSFQFLSVREYQMSDSIKGSSTAIKRAGAPPIGHLVLASPETRNALSLEMLRELRAELEALATDDACRVIVLEAEGPAFSAGHDLKEITRHRADADQGRAFFELLMAECAALMKGIVACPKPVIAKIDGVATAAGCQLVATCDLAVASDTSRFATPGVNIGLFCSTPMVALSRNVSRKHAMEMLLGGEFIDAQWAAAIGLINRSVPGGELATAVDEIAQRIAGKSRATVAIGKRAFYEQLELGLSAAYEHTSRVMVANLLTDDSEEGISAFVEKRSPVWRHV